MKNACMRFEQRGVVTVIFTMNYSSCESFECNLYKNSQSANKAISHSKPETYGRYVHTQKLAIFSSLTFANTGNLWHLPLYRERIDCTSPKLPILAILDISLYGEKTALVQSCCANLPIVAIVGISLSLYREKTALVQSCQFWQSDLCKLANCSSCRY